MSNPVILIHGGAWALPDELHEATERGLRQALAAGWSVLVRGGAALDAVEEAVAVMEDDDAFDAGKGSFLTRDGRVQMDAIIMDGATLRAGGVGCVERVRNAVRLSRLVLEKSPHVYFVAEGAERFAREQGMALIDNSELVLDRERARLEEAKKRSVPYSPETISAGPEFGHDTVGAVALDVGGNIAAATSTGGTVNKAPGRVGDASLIGCGCYADNASAAVSCTGWGEPIMKLVLAKFAADQVAAGRHPQETAEASVAKLAMRLNGRGGLILLDSQGRMGMAHNTPGMAWGYRTLKEEKTGVKLG